MYENGELKYSKLLSAMAILSRRALDVLDCIIRIRHDRDGQMVIFKPHVPTRETAGDSVTGHGRDSRDHTS
jgi:hypothetical protein